MGLIVKKEGKILNIQLNRPEARNALDPSTLMELLQIWEDFDKDPETQVAVLSSALPDIFCAGMDLKSTMPLVMRTKEPENDAERRVMENPDLMMDAMLRDMAIDKPIISAVHGLCLTGGWEMAMATDICIASQDASFQMREVQYAMMPTSGATVRLPRMIPHTAAMEILLIGDPVPAQRLYEWGFINKIVSRDNLISTAMSIAEKIASNGPLALKAIKRSVREGSGLPLKEALQKEKEIGLPIYSTEDAKEGPRAFYEKRKPVYKGR